MLNISDKPVRKEIESREYSAFSHISAAGIYKRLHQIFIGVFILSLLSMFLPWTQNITAKGRLTSLDPSQRPQTIHSIIGGRVEKWFVKEGQTVKKGDTIVYISEIKDDYFDTSLLDRTNQQIRSKEMSVKAYMEKVKALDAQIDAINSTRKTKLLQLKNLIEQATLKIESDSVNLEAAETQFNIAEEQYARAVKLQQQGLISLTDLEARKLKKQEAQAKKITASNKLLSSRNEYLNAEMELQAIDAEYRDKISKSESEKFATMSALFDAEAVVTKLQNQYMNYSVRLGLYYVTAPQNCIITRVVKPGIGETVKEGEDLVSIMPADFSLAVEWNIEPIDLPLIQVGQKVRFLFDGWPAIVFTGWPELTFGTFGGKVVAIDNFTNEEGKYRVLVAPDENETSWPSALRAGSAANGIALLKEVPVWYELWRKFNGFPPNYYAQTTDKKEK